MGDFQDTTPRWSPNGKKIAFASDRGGTSVIWAVDVESRDLRLITQWDQSNHYMPAAGDRFCWSPDGSQIAFVAAGLDTSELSADPRVISRIQYKTGFSDNRRSQIFVVSLDGFVRQVTHGDFDHHSIAWSPRSNEIVLISNREKDPDARFNYDLFILNISTGQERRLTETPGVEIGPVWSPDGESIAYTATRRELTTIDSVAEDTHLWVTDHSRGKHQEVSAALDRRAISPQWSQDGQSLFFLAGDHGKQLIFRVSRDGGQVSAVFDQPVQIGSLTVAATRMAFTVNRATVPTQIGTVNAQGGDVQFLTEVNQKVTREWDLARPETVEYLSFDGTPIEGWLIRPSNFESQKRLPLILSIHGGPHGMFGYGFNFSHQLFAAQGYAVLYLNPRGSSGYGQKFSDGCVNNWGGEIIGI
jgi:dipeptidyl aminopeptidase/acylaminoacyl peptidase